MTMGGRLYLCPGSTLDCDVCSVKGLAEKSMYTCYTLSREGYHRRGGLLFQRCVNQLTRHLFAPLFRSMRLRLR
jgi:hypothetical protein